MILMITKMTLFWKNVFVGSSLWLSNSHKSIAIHLQRINHMGASWSAVCCPLFVFEVRKEFPSEQLGSCSVAHLLLLQILFISLDLEIKTVFNVGVSRPKLDHPEYMFQRHSRDGSSLWLPGAPFGKFWVIARISIWLSINSSGKIRKHVKDCFSSTGSAFRQQVLWLEVRALDLLRRALGLLEQLSAFGEHLLRWAWGLLNT